MNLSSKINVNYVCVRHAGEQTHGRCPDGIVQICGDWPKNPAVWTVSGDAKDCREFINFLESKGLSATRVDLTRKRDQLTSLFWKAETVKDISGTDYPDTMAGRAKLNKAVCSAIAKIMTTQLATEHKVIFEHLEATCDIPATLEDLLCRARQQQQLKQWQVDIMTGQADNSGEAAYLRSAPFPRFEGKYDPDTRNRMGGGAAGSEPTITSTLNVKEQDAE